MRKYKILIADDDREHLLMMAFMCRRAGYEVVSAVDGERALQLAVEQDPDLLLLDVHMGAMDGYAVKDRLSKLGEMVDKPVIYITGDPWAAIDCNIMLKGPRAVFRKPFKMDELLMAIKQTLADRDVAVAAAPAAAGSCDDEGPLFCDGFHV